MKRSAIFVLALSCLWSAPGLYAKKKKPQVTAATPPAPAIPQMTDNQKVLHALNRLTFGPRPGDVEQVRQIGLDQWVDQQLHPEKIAENPLLEEKLRPLETLRMSTVEMLRKYPSQQLIKQMMAGRMPYPADSEAHYMAERMVERLQRKKTVGKEENDAAGNDTAANDTADRQVQSVDVLEAMPPIQQLAALNAMPPRARRGIFAAASPDLRRKIQLLNGPQQVINQDLIEGKMLRAIYSNRQLEEVLTDFWYNHFNVYLNKGADRYLVTTYERDVIRPRVLGNFKDLLLATAQSPAMLFYLDNWQSVGADANKNPKAKRRNGLNENYGRELMELHTLGVDGGYTQHDVTEVARCFTGWTIRQPQRGGGFEFNERMHDNGEKQVLGMTIPAGGGMEDGLKVIDILAHHPSTAKFISRKLATRFVSDNPPESLVDKMSRTFLATGGDLREVMRAMISAPEFWDAGTFRSKVKSPLEMLASAVRAVNGNVDFAFNMAGQLNSLGEPLYRKQEPTGYSNGSAEWMNSAALLARMNFGVALAQGKVPGVKVDPAQFTGDAAQIERNILTVDASPDARAAIDAGMRQPPEEANGKPGGKPVNPGALVAGLTLGSPDFQRR